MRTEKRGRKKLLILGVTGMLGHVLFSRLQESGFDVYGTARNSQGIDFGHEPLLQNQIMNGVDADNFDSIVHAMASIRPDVVINCIGVIKQLPEADDPLVAIPLNALLPHRLGLLCQAAGARFIHFSTDCVFDGVTGGYNEDDVTNAVDLYGRTKAMGEVRLPNCLTLRTSIIGHELKGNHGLVEWFLSRKTNVHGFTNAIYSGFPTIEMCRIIRDFVLPNPGLQGVYHVSSAPVSKYDLLRLMADSYGTKIEIEPKGDFHVNRYLDSTRFKRSTGYQPPPWPELVAAMHRHYIETIWYKK